MFIFFLGRGKTFGPWYWAVARRVISWYKTDPSRPRARAIPRERAFRPLPASSHPPSSPATARINAGGRGMSSSSASASQRNWPRYGPVPLFSCPECPQTAPLKRRVTTSDKNGNAGREYVKCESKPEPGKVRSEVPWVSPHPIFPISFYFPLFWVSSDLG